METLREIFHFNFLGFAHFSMSIRISQIKDHSISVDQARYDTSFVATYLDNATVKKSTKFYNNTLTSDMIFSLQLAEISTNILGVTGLNLGMKYIMIRLEK